VKELFTADGLNVLLDSPSDHIHHHALMLAMAVDGVNYWEEYVGPPPANVEARRGKEVHQRFSGVAVDEAGGLSWGSFGEELKWISPRDDKPALLEQRRIAATRVPPSSATLLTWESRLAVPPGKDSVVLSGAHYFGLGMRFIRSLDAVGEFRNADGKPGVVFRGDERLVRSNWCAYVVKAAGTEMTAAMFDHPDNARHPATWFTMTKPFAYLSATMALHEEPLKVEAGEPLSLCYGVALWNQRVEPGQIEKMYQRWISYCSK
jgi:hypothetical protein